MERNGFLAVTGRLINVFIPRQLRDGRPETVLRARVLVSVLMFNGMLAVILAPINAQVRGAVPGLPAPWPLVLLGLTFTAYLTSLLVFRRTGCFSLAGNIFVGYLFAVVATIAADAGVQTDRMLVWLLLVPVYSFLMMGLRWGLAWSTLTVVASGLLHYRAPVDPLVATSHIYWNWFSLLLVVVVGLVVYETVTGRLLTLLERERSRFAHAADHDGLTGLPNRTAFDRELLLAVDEALAAGRPLALAFLDLDGFKPINDTHGHQAGDEVLRVVARRLLASFREYDLVARIGGDEFAVVLRRAAPPPPAPARLEAALAEIRAPIHWEGVDLQVSASVGVVLFPGHGRTATDLLAAADAAMYRAKESGGRVIVGGPAATGGHETD
ncbi:hypothetical protein DRQ50_08665 [bacterium]|nr:MAG: hypothetical protein DRQ50_08665 [bacterium]